MPGSASGQFAALSGASGCTIRTASDGTVYVFWLGWDQQLKRNGIYMVTSSDGGATFAASAAAVQDVHTGVFDPVQRRYEMNGITGARDDLSDAPSIDIANGAPTGTGATNRIVLSWVDGADGLNHEHVLFTTFHRRRRELDHPGSSRDLRRPWPLTRQPSSPATAGTSTPSTTRFLAPYQKDTANPRPLVAVVKHADIAANGATGSFGELNRGTAGDARASSANALSDEFLGDYVYGVATNDYGAAIWNDVRRADDCPAVDAWRMSLEGGPSAPQPAPEQDCPAGFGNTDIFGGSWPEPAP